MMILLSLLLQTQSIDPLYLESLYSRQDPKSLTKQLYFYSQYPETKEGLRARSKILELLNIDQIDPIVPLELNSFVFNELLKAIFKTSDTPISLDETSIQFIKKLSKSHKHKNLKGSDIIRIKDLEKASIEDIDVGRGMLLLAFGDTPEALNKIKSYEAVLDFMAVCIKARLTPSSSPEDMVHSMNHFIFFELGYRFPAFSEHEERIDTYTILPSVLDNRQGVCLGVSLLFYSLAQRLGLPLDIYTPPGHIFLSLHEDLNIETTARGIHMPLERYLSLHVKELKKRNQKELLGMALFNQASVFLQKEDFKAAASLYENALLYIPNDPQILELLASCYFMNQDMKKAHVNFTKLKNIKQDTLLSSNYVLEDFFKGLITPKHLKAVFQSVEPNMQSLLKKAHELELLHKQSPRFRSGLYQLGITYLQLHQYEKALEAFEKLYKEATNDPALLYYLTQLSLIRFDRPKTLFYKKQLEIILKKNDYEPLACQRLFEEIEDLWPSRIDKKP